MKHFEDVVGAFTSAVKDEGNDFIEGLVYSHDSTVIMLGQMTDDLEPDKVISLIFFCCIRYRSMIESWLVALAAGGEGGGQLLLL